MLIEFTLTLQRVDEDIRVRLQNASMSELMATLKDRAETALKTAQGILRNPTY